MQPKLVYIERKTKDGVFLNHRGPAVIAAVTFSKSGKSIYYKGMAFRRAGGGQRTRLRDQGCGLVYGNYFQYDPEKENEKSIDSLQYNQVDEFWISGVKKRGSNRQKGFENIPVVDNGDL